jgi:hypothetical protein
LLHAFKNSGTGVARHPKKPATAGGTGVNHRFRHGRPSQPGHPWHWYEWLVSSAVPGF